MPDSRLSSKVEQQDYQPIWPLKEHCMNGRKIATIVTNRFIAATGSPRKICEFFVIWGFVDCYGSFLDCYGQLFGQDGVQK